MIKKLLLLTWLLLLSGKIFSQDFTVTQPRLTSNSLNIGINYDIPAAKSSDKYFVWIEVRKKNGEQVQSTAFYGDVGPYVKAGNNKSIIWIPENDSLLNDKELSYVIKGEKYERGSGKGPAVLSSLLLPGLGQTKLSDGKPWWLTGVAAYGAVGGGLIMRFVYKNTYSDYKVEPILTKRNDLLNKAQKQANISDGLIIGGAALWVVNIFWTALMPNSYKPIKHTEVTFYNMPYINKTTYVGLVIKF